MTGEPRARLSAAETLERAALRYLEKFDSSAKNLERILKTHARRLAVKEQRSVDELLPLIGPLLLRYQASGLIDDARYAQNRVETLRARGASERAIRHKLGLKSVASVTVDLALSRAAASSEGDAELLAARRFLKRRRRGKSLSPGRNEKDLAALARAGFSFSVARSALVHEGQAAEGDEPLDAAALSAGARGDDGDSWP